MPFGDQSIINDLKINLITFILNNYVIFGTTIYNKKKIFISSCSML